MTTKITGDLVATDSIVAGNIAAGAVGTSEIADGGVANADVAAGFVVQVVNVQSGAVATGTTVIPNDDTIPQNTEGNEVMTLAITPKSATNKLKIDVVVNMGSGATGNLIAALFQDTTANALAAQAVYTGSTNASVMLSFTHYMTAGTASATTFKVRIGCNNAGTVTFNGYSAARYMGGVMASSITITEIKA